MGIFFTVLFVAVFVLLIVVGLKQAAARRKELAALAAKRGWSFREDDDGDFPERFEPFDCFNRGSSRRIFNTLRGEVPSRFGSLALQSGDYRYTTGSGKHRHTHRLSYLLMQLPIAVPPTAELLIRPEHIGDSLTALVGFDDIDFESEEFSRRYFVKSTDRKFAYAVIHAPMMEYLLASPCGHLQLRGKHVVLSPSSNETWTPQQIEDAVAWFVGFFERWPEYLVSELRQNSG